MIRYIAFFKTTTMPQKYSFDVDTSNVRTGNSLARKKAKELIKSTDTNYIELVELVRIDNKSNWIYSDNNGGSHLVVDVKI